MCLICVELIKQRMTIVEARKACTEIIRSESDDHTEELLIAIDNMDLEKLGELLEESDG